MRTSEAQKRAVAKNQEKTDLIRIRVPKGNKEKYQALADKQNKSLTAYIKDLLEKQLEEEQ